MTKFKLNILTITLALLAITIYSCNSDSDTINKSSFSDQELNKFSKAHSNGLDAIINDYTKRKSKNSTFFKKNNTEIDTIALINYVKEQSLIFLKTQELTYSGNLLDFNTFTPLNNNKEIEIIRNFDNTTNYLLTNSKINNYHILISDALLTSNDFNEFKFKIDNIKIQAKSDDTLEEGELLVILGATGIAIDSINYWNSFSKSNKNNYSKMEWDWGLTMTDLMGAVAYGEFGLAAGPAGAAVMALSGALINSSMAYILGEI